MAYHCQNILPFGLISYQRSFSLCLDSSALTLAAEEVVAAVVVEVACLRKESPELLGAAVRNGHSNARNNV